MKKAAATVHVLLPRGRNILEEEEIDDETAMRTKGVGAQS
jgi:hypothetical protein